MAASTAGPKRRLRNETTDRTIDGTDITKALQNLPVEREIPASWTFPVHSDVNNQPGMSMRDGKHVLIATFDAPGISRKEKYWRTQFVKSAKLKGFQLYDLSSDRSQIAPLNERRPEELARMKQKMIKLWQSIQTDAPDWSKE